MNTVVNDEPSTSQKRAREIMGGPPAGGFFGIEEAIKHFGVNPSNAQTAALSEVPFTEEVLKSCKGTHVLVAVFPMSILDIRRRTPRTLFWSHEDSWLNKEAFAKECGEIDWRLVRKHAVPDSTARPWAGEDGQLQRLSENEEVPSARVVFYTTIGHYLATGERLLESVFVRTSSVDSDGDRVSVGGFDGSGLHIYNWWDGDRSGHIGVSSARKSS